MLRLLGHARGERRAVAWAATASVVNKVLDLAPPALIGVAVDAVVHKQDSVLAKLGIVEVRAQLVALTWLTIIIFVLESLFEYAYAVAWRGLAQRIQHALRVQAYDHVQRLDLAWFEDRSTGGLLTILRCTGTRATSSRSPLRGRLGVRELHQFRVQRNGYALQKLADRAVDLGVLRASVELFLTDTRNLGFQHQVDADDTGAACHRTQLHLRVAIQFIRRETCVTKQEAQLHRETTGVCSRDQFLWIGACLSVLTYEPGHE